MAKQFDEKTIKALARARRAVGAASRPDGASEFNVRLIAAEMRDAINVLDNAGVFAALDEQTDYASAEEILNDSHRRRIAQDRLSDPKYHAH